MNGDDTSGRDATSHGIDDTNAGGIDDPALTEGLRRFDRASSRLLESDALKLRQELIDRRAVRRPFPVRSTVPAVAA